jgi:hypothetical protein
MLKLDLAEVAESDKAYRKDREMGTLQTVVYIMCGGGILGHFAAEQPADFYIDDRVGKLAYPKRQILQAKAKA